MTVNFHVGAKPWQTVHDLDVWIVDGDAVRNKGDVKFTDAADHYMFPKLIPMNELWISKDIDKDQWPFLRDFLLTLHREMGEGESYTKAEEAAEKTEEKERERADPVKRTKKGEKIPLSAFGPVIRKFSDGVVVRWVDGDLIRNKFIDSFTEGGNDYAYPQFPAKTVGLDDDGTDKADIPFILIHEKRERNLMESGLSYDKAHAKANELEGYARAHPKEAEAILKRLGNPKLEPVPGSTIGRSSAA